ncbi:MAG TPA: energy-coupling factor transporter transmembrane component T [Thermomicrobiaceae bacterium]|nr:energy-coupling factor transporter transmembrane component T [Thermomicrobiaceae bacterium]
MSGRPNAASWLAWSGAATLAVVATRNPLYVTLAGAAVGASFLSLDRGTTACGAWRLILRVGLVVAAIGVGFNLLTVHAGDLVLANLPASLPIVGGPITGNALVYGLASAVALLDLLLVAATFSSAVDRPALLRLVPDAFVAPGVAAVIALSIFPQTLRAASEVREAQATRGFQVRSPRDVVPLLVPTLRLGLEHAFDLAETMESRAFGSGVVARRPASRRLLGAGLVLATASVILFGLDDNAGGVVSALAALAILVAPSLWRRERHPRYRPFSWGLADAAVLGASALALVLLVTALVGSSALAYSPYPALTWPPLAASTAAADVLLVTPALVALGVAT